MSHYQGSLAQRSALGPRSRPAELRRLALVERGETFLAEGKKAMARKDFERVRRAAPTTPDSKRT